MTPKALTSLVSAMVTLVVTALLSWTLIEDQTPTLLRRLDLWIYDSWVKTTLHSGGESPVTVLEIDEASLERFGQWPWPRDLVGRIVQRAVDEAGARVVAFDIIFAEPDRSDGPAIRDRIERLGPEADGPLRREMETLLSDLDRDTTLAQSLRGKPVVLGYYFNNDPKRRVGELPEPWLPADFAHQVGVRPPVSVGYGANLSALVQAAGRAGHVNPAVDVDGVVRRIPLAIEFEGMLYPSLTLSVLNVLAGDKASIDFGKGQSLDGQEVTESLTVGPYRLPIDGAGRSLIPFFGGKGSTPRLSVADLMAGTYNPALLKGKVVVLGPTAPGLKDSRPTPVDPDQPGVELHASWLRGALTGHLPFNAYYTNAAVLSLLWVVGLCLLVGARGLKPAVFSLSSLALLAAVWGLGRWLWASQQVVLPISLPLTQIALLFVGLGTLGYLLETRSKKAVNNLFGRYVPPELVNEMNRDPARYSMSARSEELTVMFSDVRGFTALSERMTPEDLAELMNALLTTLSRVIRADHLGTIDKYIGDCVMAFWGAPVPRADHAGAAVAAALDMHKALAALVPTLKAPEGATIAIGVGLNTGRAVVGNMGSAYRMAYTVLGDTVNTAARLEGLTSFYGVGVVVGDSVRAAAAEGFVWRQLDLVRVKGRNAPLAIHEPMERAGQAPAALVDQARRHEAALAAYQSRRFDEALAQWQALQREAPCTLHALWCERAAYSLENPPPEAWDGVFNFQTK